MMPVSVTYVKFCPTCQTSTALDTAICAHCGHQFRSHLVAPISEKTLSMNALDMPAGQQTGFLPRPPAAPKSRIPRPLLALVLGLALVSFLIGSLVHHTASTRRAVRDGASLMPAPGSPPYDAVFLPAPGQQMVPVATRRAGDLRRWLQLQRPVGAKDSGPNAKSDYPETVHLYLSRRILLIASGTPARVLAEGGAWRQVRILGGAHSGAIGFAPRQTVLRPGKAGAGGPQQTLTIP